MMSKSDQWVIIIVIAMLLLHLVLWTAGYRANKLSLFIAAANLVTGSSLIIYWAVKQLQITQHYIELREVVVLGLEVIVVACAVYEITVSQKSNLVKVVQYIFFGIHFTVLIAALIFLLTFKMNKLM
jgi:hypothetical protein